MKSLCLLVSLALASSSAPAAPDNPLQIQDEKALAHFTAGMDAWLAKDYATAQRQLEAAYEIEPLPSLLYSLGQLARVQGDCDLAHARFAAFLKTGPTARATEDTGVNLERCEPREPRPQTPAPSLDPTLEPGTSSPAMVADGPSRRSVDHLGLSLTIVGGALTVAGAGVFGAAFAEQARAGDETSVSGFERRLGVARAEYWSGVAIGTVGVGLLVGGIVRLVQVRRKRGTAKNVSLAVRHSASWRY